MRGKRENVYNVIRMNEPAPMLAKAIAFVVFSAAGETIAMDTNDLLRCAIQVIGRVALPPDRVREIVGTGKKYKKQLNAFNLCNGSRTQKEIAQESGISQGNLSRTLTRWRKHGILFVFGSGKQSTFLHIYPLPPTEKKKKEP
jgi:hypothetical protein